MFACAKGTRTGGLLAVVLLAYSAAFPPPGQTEPGPAFAGTNAKAGRATPRS